jgi:UDP-glucose 4-epimerase
MKNIIIVTGGAGFVGSNLISLLIKKTKFKIISIDDYSTGKKKNHINEKRITYVKENTKNINRILKTKKKQNKNSFSFWRIFQNISKLFENE